MEKKDKATIDKVAIGEVEDAFLASLDKLSASSEPFSAFLSHLRASENTEIGQILRLEKKDFDLTWIEKIEEGMPEIDKIVENPRQFIKQERDENKSPVFTTQVFIEGLEGCVGTGYSKKESQQNASKDTLQRLRREPQFIDAVFAAKADRTKMEEEPVMCVPDPEQEQQNFIIEQEPEVHAIQYVAKNSQPNKEEKTEQDDDFSLDDITATPRAKTREEIIAEAEAAAFAEQGE